jgi:predicted enzyme related to lactoylglutathione lyase
VINNIRIGDISIDCANPSRTRDFYTALASWEKREANVCPAVVSNGGLLILFMGCDFEYASPIWLEEPGKQQKQMHFIFQVNDVPSTVEEAIKLGATTAAAQYDTKHYVTMHDPEGHPFCL